MTEQPTVDRTRLSRVVSHALRHEPWLYELELDDEGWAPVDVLLAALREQGPHWSCVDRDELAEMIRTSAKRRHELDGDRIRALYGHSVPGRLVKVESDPPTLLHHGTSPQAWAEIQRVGLLPMRRQFVHLSVDVATAQQVGRRKSAAPVILTVRAAEASEAGTRFFFGNDVVWLADHVPARFLSVDRPPSA